jgi:S-formylglutathione hydrolase FrmB
MVGKLITIDPGLPAARSRGVFGFSSGGFGSWNLASRNPDVFGAMAVLSAEFERYQVALEWLSRVLDADCARHRHNRRRLPTRSLASSTD